MRAPKLRLKKNKKQINKEKDLKFYRKHVALSEPWDDCAEDTGTCGDSELLLTIKKPSKKPKQEIGVFLSHAPKLYYIVFY